MRSRFHTDHRWSAPRRFLRQFGLDVVRWPDARYESQRQKMLASTGIRTVLDVGANAGQYGRELRAFGYRGRILSLEPLSEPFQQLSTHAKRDAQWLIRRVAVGADNCVVSMHVAANYGASSSVLNMLPAHETAAPEARYIGTETVEQVTLDSLEDEEYLYGPLHLKIDVQGYERWVLDGAVEVLRRVESVELELSFVPLYEGGMLFPEALESMRALGFGLSMLDPGFRDPNRQLLMQADGFFVRQ